MIRTRDAHGLILIRRNRWWRVRLRHASAPMLPVATSSPNLGEIIGAVLLLGGLIVFFAGVAAFCAELLAWLHTGLLPATPLQAYIREPVTALIGLNRIFDWYFDQPVGAALMELGFAVLLLGGMVDRAARLSRAG